MGRPTLEFRKQIKLTEADVIGKLHHRHSADRVIASHDLEEWLFAKSLAVQPHLKGFVPPPALHDARPHCRAFSFERIAKRLFVLR